MYGGLLFLDGNINKAKEVFEEYLKQNFTYDEKYRTYFEPRDPANTNNPLRFTGKIVTVKPGYLFIQTTRYPDLISRRTRIGNVILQRGMSVEFEPTFSARGAYADHIQFPS